MARRAVEQELSRDIILNVARKLFVESGYRSVSMRNIANELGYSHGSLYYHFRDKAELFYALVVEDFNYLITKQRAMLEQSELKGLPLLEAIMLEFIRFGLTHPHHYEIMFLIKDRELQRYSRTEQAQNMDLFSSIVQAALNDHPRYDELRFTMPWNLFTALHGFITHCIHYELTFENVEKLAGEHVSILCRGVQMPVSRRYYGRKQARMRTGDG